MSRVTASDHRMAPLCKCHSLTQDWVVDHWTCAEKRRKRQLAFYHRRKHDPDYQLDRQLREMTRFRVR